MRIALSLILVALFLAPSGQSWTCEPTTSDPELDTGANPVARFYFDHDPCQTDCMDAYWIYEESNGYDGLQRGDEVKDDTCGGRIASDTIIF